MNKSELEKKVSQLEQDVIEIRKELSKCDKVELGSVEIGGLVMICDHPFKVIKHTYNDGVVLLCNDFIAENQVFGDNRDYRTSKVRMICDRFGEKIVDEFGSENVFYMPTDLTSVCGVKDLQVMGDVRCRPMTFEEFRDFGDAVINEDLDDWYWLASPWGTENRGYKNSVAVVSPSGNINYNVYRYRYGVRPICILKSNIFVSKGE